MEYRVLKALYQLYCYFDEGYYFPHKTIIKELPYTNISPKRLSKILARLRQKGLVDYQNGLFNDDGEVGGSGNSLTNKAIEAMEEAIW